MDATAPEIPPLAECFALGDASAHWPTAAGGRRVHRSTIWRYATVGIAGNRLRTMRIPGVGLVTCARWIAEFVARVNSSQVQS